MKTLIGNYAYEVTNELRPPSEPARWTFVVHKTETEGSEQLVCSGDSPSREHAEREAQQLIALCMDLDRIVNSDPQCDPPAESRSQQLYELRRQQNPKQTGEQTDEQTEEHTKGRDAA
jgi:hypothetical protein